MKILKSLTALLPKPKKTVQGAVVDFDGECLTLLTFDGQHIRVPLECIAGQVSINQVITARVPTK